MTKRVMLKKEKERGTFTVFYEWEEIEPGLFSFVGDPEESK
jgi:hypothetical protein